jgi:hypothetical protein
VTEAHAGVRRRAGFAGALMILAVYGGLALTIDPLDVRRTPADPTATPGFQSDEATYYLMGQSLVRDFDLEYRQEDLARTRAEFPLGPSGVFLKRGTTLAGAPDPDASRLYYGKSFAFPLVAAPFVAVFGTNGFYVFNSVLLALAFLCAYTFLSARSGIGVSLLLAGGFILPTVVPVYWAWIAPELFNWSLTLVAYFCWLYKLVASSPSSSKWTVWLRGSSSDIVAALIIGMLTFSKASNALLLGPMVVWWLWRRHWRLAVAVTLVGGLSAIAWFGANAAISGEWNYQGGDRTTCHGAFPFEAPGRGLETCPARTTSEAMTNVWFDPDMFWTNLRANLWYFVSGRYGGVFPYFFPVVFGAIALGLAVGRREPWQWLVLASLGAQAMVFLITQPYSYFGGGGSVGNRYFMAAFGMAVFLLPPIRSVVASLVPWVVGGLFMAPLVLSPFDTSMRPGDRAFSGPLRLLPVELTNYKDLPVTTERGLMVRGFGATEGHPGFLLMYLDKNSFLQEADGLSFWTRGKSRAELLVRTNEPERRFELALSSGPLPVNVEITLEGKQVRVSLEPDRRTLVQLEPGPGFPYKNFEGQKSYIWRLSITTDNGWSPAEREGSHDTRFLGVRVKPLIVP